jgi:tRNA A37 methylthiotransferase MiaB
MHRPYNKKQILSIISNLKLVISNLSLGTDIIVGFPTETDIDFQQTYNLCRQLGFSKLHVFRFSPRPGTAGLKLFKASPKINNLVKKSRSQKLRSLTAQTTLPSHQTPNI